jgi:hypothetical protein
MGPRSLGSGATTNAGRLDMSEIPLHLQRRFEQRWAARFSSPVASAAPKSVTLKATVKSLPRAATAKEKPAELSQRAESVRPVGIRGEART